MLPDFTLINATEVLRVERTSPYCQTGPLMDLASFSTTTVIAD